MVVGLLMTPFLLSRLGQEEYGVWLVTAQVLLYLGLLDFGVVALVPREAAFAWAEGENEKAIERLRALVGRTLQVVLLQTPIVALSVGGFLFFMPERWAEYSLIFTVILVAYLLRYPLRVFMAVLLGLQDFRFTGRVQLASLIASTLLTVGLVLRGYGLLALAVSWAFAQLIPILISIVRLKWRFPGVIPSRLPSLDWPEVRALWRKGRWASLAQLTQMLVNGTDLVIIGQFLGAEAVVVYACTSKLAMTLLNLPNLILRTAQPALSQMRASESKESLLRVSTSLTHVVVVLSGAIILAILVANAAFVSLWVGAEFYGGLTLTLLLLLRMFFRHVNDTFLYAIFAFGHDRQNGVSKLFDGIVYLSLAFLASPWLGLMAIPLASIAGVATVSIPWGISTLARESGVSRFQLIGKSAGVLWRVLALIAISYGVLWFYTPRNVMVASLCVVATLTIYALVMFAALRGSPSMLYIKPVITSLRKRFLSRPRSAFAE